MLYCDEDDLLSLIPYNTLAQLTNDEPGVVEPDFVVINQIISNVCENMDAKLRGRYTLPFSAVPTPLRDIAIKKCRFEIYSRRPDGGDLPTAITLTNKEANDNLQQIADGRMSLGVQVSDTAVPEPGPWRVKAPPRRFNPGA